ncbi:haloalkane dehalogenase [Glycomyces sp. TRM65418]|uniref:haloalkane dehalogenase n=1 Tax=Glycomyces sp. TRM65418 TaxID=2867006 RepID=UPI001CE668A2|nr:haloalkane dehalogenase [Glycomyces sp. TRM65418]MCC3764591.1 haloalkane dehalogenase [Glycomyces sp. TRM65418]QZD54255.1 haloalkane dehalogenase [Glycomyces sp. TRM65418]
MKRVDLLDSHMSYVDEGAGEGTVVLLHGNPTSSHIWRHVVPRLAGAARVVAPDLIGMGESGKPDIDYSFADQAAYLEAFLAAIGVERPVLVGYDWGGSLALDWAARHPGRARGLVLMETFLRPMTWAEFPTGATEFFRTLRTPGAGEQMALAENWFIEHALRATNPGIADEDLAAYRKPFPDPDARRPLLAWPRQIPLAEAGGPFEPAAVAERFEAYAAWAAATPEVPKLLLTGSPHALGSPAMTAWAKEHVAGLEVASIGEEVGHHAPEDAPEAIAEAVLGLLARLP